MAKRSAFDEARPIPWKQRGDSAFLVIEDDAQNGVDHVDGHRVPAFVISP
jgi:hypothetical protein